MFALSDLYDIFAPWPLSKLYVITSAFVDLTLGTFKGRNDLRFSHIHMSCSSTSSPPYADSAVYSDFYYEGIWLGPVIAGQIHLRLKVAEPTILVSSVSAHDPHPITRPRAINNYRLVIWV